MTIEEQARSLQDYETAVSFVSNHRQLAAESEKNASKILDLENQVSWLKKQLFGQKSEKRIPEYDPRQLSLGEFADSSTQQEPKLRSVAAHVRRSHPRTEEEEGPASLIDPSIPVREVRILPPEVENLDESEYEIISEKESLRLVQKPVVYEAVKVIRPVVKLKEKLLTAPLPDVLEKSYADVSFLAGMAVDKFLYHLPLYRIHQRLTAQGINLSRFRLTDWMHRVGELLEPIARAQKLSILSGGVSVDETPIKAGVKERGKLKQGYFWVLYGAKEEVYFEFHPSRALLALKDILYEQGAAQVPYILTDGYQVYEKYAEANPGLIHANCWSHARREFVEAEELEPEIVTEALSQIRQLYRIEESIREKYLEGEKKLRYRQEHAKPVLESFFEWCEQTLTSRLLLPSSPVTKALGYVLRRKTQLSVYLSNPEIPIDTNHLERQIRPLPLGRKNWLFCWSEVGAKHVATIQSLLQTCRLQNIDPFVYLVDVLQRIQNHPISQVEDLIPRNWKNNFAENPLKAVLL
jgi:transposase